jgi:hypothetical protein
MPLHDTISQKAISPSMKIVVLFHFSMYGLEVVSLNILIGNPVADEHWDGVGH